MANPGRVNLARRTTYRTHSEMVKDTAERSGIPLDITKQVVTYFINTLLENIVTLANPESGAEKQTVRIEGFGTFFLAPLPDRTMRGVRGGNDLHYVSFLKVRMPGRKRIIFRPHKWLRSAINQFAGPVEYLDGDPKEEVEG